MRRPPRETPRAPPSAGRGHILTHDPKTPRGTSPGSSRTDERPVSPCRYKLNDHQALSTSQALKGLCTMYRITLSKGGTSEYDVVEFSRETQVEGHVVSALMSPNDGTYLRAVR